jgi:hypothetical protein
MFNVFASLAEFEKDWLFRISWDVAINVNMGYSVIGKIYNPQ